MNSRSIATERTNGVDETAHDVTWIAHFHLCSLISICFVW
jgi:hypothetical protein